MKHIYLECSDIIHELNSIIIIGENKSKIVFSKKFYSLININNFIVNGMTIILENNKRQFIINPVNY